MLSHADHHLLHLTTIIRPVALGVINYPPLRVVIRSPFVAFVVTGHNSGRFPTSSAQPSDVDVPSNSLARS